MARVWLITGTGTGIGAELVHLALQRGDRVVATHRRSPAEQGAGLSSADGHLLEVRADVTDPAQIGEAVRSGVERFGRIDVVVNNAGFAQPGVFEELDDAAFRAQLETNLFGGVNVLRAALPVLRAQRSGHVLQVSSIAGQVGAAGMSAYTASKHALEGWSASLAAELAPLGIRLTVVEPGSTATSFRRRWSDRLDARGSIPDYVAAHRSLESTAQSRHRAGDPARTAAALVTIVDHPPAALRVALGSDAYATIRSALQGRLLDLENDRALSLSTDQAAHDAPG